MDLTPRQQTALAAVARVARSRTRGVAAAYVEQTRDAWRDWMIDRARQISPTFALALPSAGTYEDVARALENPAAVPALPKDSPCR